MVQPIHNLFDARRKVPPMHEENVDVARAELLEGSFDGDVHGLEAIAGVVDLHRDGRVSTFVVRRILREAGTG